ncbi:hypothetical protein SAMN05421819_1038 [Bryocella elongata]|uniref:Uncharacterized protein n=1 Tax=Bryocella elongata TaxID=863522 RepID=A0A1H5UI28_9BACT|nr:hypothetical protein [Bryocella elongata]SEF74686.1 hypothetical protein SAMN05421819_1038 [Bryocella elongata]
MQRSSLFFAALLGAATSLGARAFQTETTSVIPPDRDPAVWGRAHQPYIATVMVSGAPGSPADTGQTNSSREVLEFRDDAGRVRTDSFYDSGQLMASTVRDSAQRTMVICMAVPKQATVLRGIAAGYVAPGTNVPPGAGWVAEPLPAKRIAGILKVPGQRFTRTFTINGKTDTQIVEDWTDPDLGIVLEHTATDSLHGTRESQRVTHLVLSRPDASLFEVPAGYEVRDTQQASH